MLLRLDAHAIGLLPLSLAARHVDDHGKFGIIVTHGRDLYEGIGIGKGCGLVIGYHKGDPPMGREGGLGRVYARADINQDPVIIAGEVQQMIAQAYLQPCPSLQRAQYLRQFWYLSHIQ